MHSSTESLQSQCPIILLSYTIPLTRKQIVLFIDNVIKSFIQKVRYKNPTDDVMKIETDLIMPPTLCEI